MSGCNVFFATKDGLFERRFDFFMVLSVFLVVSFVIFCNFDLAFSSSGDGYHDIAWGDSDTFKVFNFAVLSLLLFIILRKPAVTALNDRIRGIKENFEELESKKKKVEADLVVCDNKLAKLDEDASLILSEYVKQGEESRAMILVEAESSIEKLRVQAKANIKREFEIARLRLQSEIVEKALIEAEEMVRERIDSNDQDKLIDEYLSKVVA